MFSLLRCSHSFLQITTIQRKSVPQSAAPGPKPHWHRILVPFTGRALSVREKAHTGLRISRMAKRMITGNWSFSTPFQSHFVSPFFSPNRSFFFCFPPSYVSSRFKFVSSNFQVPIFPFLLSNGFKAKFDRNIVNWKILYPLLCALCANAFPPKMPLFVILDITSTYCCCLFVRGGAFIPRNTSADTQAIFNWSSCFSNRQLWKSRTTAREREIHIPNTTWRVLIATHLFFWPKNYFDSYAQFYPLHRYPSKPGFVSKDSPTGTGSRYVSLCWIFPLPNWATPPPEQIRDDSWWWWFDPWGLRVMYTCVFDLFPLE